MQSFWNQRRFNELQSKLVMNSPGGPRRLGPPYELSCLVVLEISNHLAVVAASQVAERREIDIPHDRPDAAVAKRELADCGVIAAEHHIGGIERSCQGILRSGAAGMTGRVL